ncbi:MAG: UPF0175 family protein [Acidobacteria bacterium]|nr:UPF0175 family protein [Acidobacteriota bacterium]
MGLVREVELIEEVERSDYSTIVRGLLARAVHAWKLEHSARQYSEGKITLTRAAHDAGVKLWEMTDYARASNVPTQYELEDLQQDRHLQRFNAGIGGRSAWSVYGNATRKTWREPHG